MAAAGAGGGDGLEVRLLGPVRADYRGRPLELGGVQARSVLAVLLLLPNQVVPRGVIARNAWRGDPPATARNLVAAYVSRLRTALSPAAAQVSLAAVAPGFLARIDPELIDAHRFTVLMRRAERDRAAREDELAIAHLERALALWEGHALALEDMEADWLRAQAAALQERRLDALEQLAELYCGAGRPDQAVALLRGEAPGHPQRDEMIATLVSALAATEQSAVAVTVADRAIDALESAGLPVGPRLREARRRSQRPSAAPGAPGPPRQLPPDTGAFTGRERELADLSRLADEVRLDDAGAPVVVAIDGMAGIGKTALAVHAGHRLAGQFPDGQLFVDLYGFTQGVKRRDAVDVLADVLRTLGVPAQQIPDDVASCAALYRDRLAGKRMLVVLDNADGEDQVRPLLPGHPGCLVLVTSRLRLRGLDDARVLSLDVLPVTDALALLRTVAGPGRIPADDPLLQEIAHLCGNLPLALRITGALLRHRPSWNLAHLAGKLRDARPALAEFRDGDRDLAAVFDLSYYALPTDWQRLYRGLGSQPGADIDAFAAAALLDTDPDHAETVLQHLVDHNLLAEAPPGRYRMYDLIRAHALGTAAQHADERDNALIRLLGYYEHTVHRAAALIGRPPRPAPRSPAPVHAPEVENAAKWLRTEGDNLKAALTLSIEQVWDEHTIALGAGVAALLLADGPWSQAAAVLGTVAAAAERVGDRLEQAGALVDLIRLRMVSGDFAGAADATSRALWLYRDLENRLGQAVVLVESGRIRMLTDDRSGAVDAYTEALKIYRELGDRLGQAYALSELGRLRLLTARFPLAAAAYSEAFDIFRELGDRFRQGYVVGELGRISFLTGDYSAAADAHTQALEAHREVGNPLGEADALLCLGRVRRATEDFPAATEAVNQALKICRDRDFGFGQASALIELGHVRLASGDAPGAADLLSGAVAMCRELGSRSGEASALNRYAAALAALGESARALTLYRDALEINHESEWRDEEARSLEGIGDCLVALGDTDAGTDHLRRAMELFRRLGMRPDADRVEARLSQSEP